MRPKLMYSSLHNIYDSSSGAAISMRTMLQKMVQRGYEVRTLSSDLFDSEAYGLNEFLYSLRKSHIEFDVKDLTYSLDGETLDLKRVDYLDSGMFSTSLFVTRHEFKKTSPIPLKDLLYLRVHHDILNRFLPNAYVTYGGYWVARTAVRLAKQIGAGTAFFLHNLSYTNREILSFFDKVVVPSQFARRYYEKHLGVRATVIPPSIDFLKVQTIDHSGKYLTFVNPSPEKGVYFFAGLARELANRRPDIPILIVESRAKVASLEEIPDFLMLKNLSRQVQVDDPREFLKVTRVLLVPSLCEETFGRLIVEAGYNKIPCVFSNRGALPETSGNSLVCLPISSRFDLSFRGSPSSEELKPWYDAIVNLWDDEDYAGRVGRQLFEKVSRFNEESTLEKNIVFFTKLLKSRGRR